MKRRLALQRVALLMGGVAVAPGLAGILNSCKSASDTAAGSAFSLSKDQQSLLAEITEVIIPKTDTPGAKDLKVAEIMEVLLKDCYPETQQKHFTDGLKTVEEESKKLGGDFVSLKSEDKLKVLEIMKQAASTENEANKKKEEAEQIDSESGQKKVDHGKDKPPVPFFYLVKDLTVFGYYSSKYGITEAFDYTPVPGRYDGCIKVGPDALAYS